MHQPRQAVDDGEAQSAAAKSARIAAFGLRKLFEDGALAFFYGLSLWSLWYWRSRQLPDQEVDGLALDFPDGEGGGIGA